MTPIVRSVSRQGGTPHSRKKCRDDASIQRKKFGNQTMPAGSQSPNSTLIVVNDFFHCRFTSCGREATKAAAGD
jgi:hypothetical protein